MTNRQITSCVYAGRSLTAFDAEIKANVRRKKLADAQARQQRDHAARIATTLAFARSQSSGFRRVA